MFGLPSVRVADRLVVGTATTSVSLTIDTSGLNFTPRHLLIRAMMTNDSSHNGSNIGIQYNSDTGSNYSYQLATAYNTTKAAYVGTIAYDAILGNITNASGDLCAGEVLVLDAFSTRSHKSSIGLVSRDAQVIREGYNRWANTAAITSVTIFTVGGTGKFDTGSAFEVLAIDENYNIDEQILGSDGQFDVSSISASNGSIVQILNSRSDYSGDVDDLKIEINSDTTSGNYRRQSRSGIATTAAASSASSSFIGTTCGNTAVDDAFGAAVLVYPNFADGSAADRSYQVMSGHVGDGSDSRYFFTGGSRDNTEAITALSIVPTNGTNFLTDSMLSTYVVGAATDTRVLLARVELASDNANMGFSSIDSGYHDLEVVGSIRSARAGISEDGMYVTLNSDTTDGNYVRQIWLTNGTGNTVARATSNRAPVDFAAANATANVFSSFQMTLYEYDNTVFNCTMTLVSDDSTENEMRVVAYQWLDTDVVTDIAFTSQGGANFLAGSVMELYGHSGDAYPLVPAGYTIFF